MISFITTNPEIISAIATPMVVLGILAFAKFQDRKTLV